MRLGIDVGSTTLKTVLLGENDEILFASYERHYSKIAEKLNESINKIIEKYGDAVVKIAFSGSAGMGVAEALNASFVQEVYAEKKSVEKFCPGTDAVIELGGEDAKILFLTGGFEMRMNGTCAGGTGAFIDQMATLMEVTPETLNNLAVKNERVYSIASRCGVFAKSDVQPLLNQGARKEDVAAGIFYAVVHQTVAGLAQGRKIGGNVLYLGGPLTFMPFLRGAFDDVLKVKGVCPENSLYFVAMGAALSPSTSEISLSALYEKIKNVTSFGKYETVAPLFKNQAEYDEFTARHKKNSEGIKILSEPPKVGFLGVDAGSTTVKVLIIDENGNVFRPYYTKSTGKPTEIVQAYLTKLYEDYPNIVIAGSAVTGYGEKMIQSAFRLDYGIVETMAHYFAAKKFMPDVDFILDVGGQDIKCFKIKNGVIDQLFLNEACSSGCGSFLQTFAKSLGYEVEEFAKIGLFANAPVNLGSRCTVFMNSSVKQAQKDGATIDNISAGLSISVVKNALYKVIRCASAKDLGKNIVVQGGTFLNDCVLRAFEREIGGEVVRPELSALMGAYGAALYALKLKNKAARKLLTAEELKRFKHSVKNITCGGCGNRCALTVNDFGDGKKFIAGNRCEKPLGKSKDANKNDDIYAYKISRLSQYIGGERQNGKLNVGLPLGLNMYELLPFWHEFFVSLGFNVFTSPLSTREIYLEGQYSIPSDTACYPAKLMHGHIEELLKKNPDVIFYPDMSYNFDEKQGVDHFNCPVVAYYPQVLKANVKALEKTTFVCDFLSLANRKIFEKRITEILNERFSPIAGKTFTKKEISRAADFAYIEYSKYMEDIEAKATEIISRAQLEGKPIIVLAGRPYHLDPEINHGVNEILRGLGVAIVSEDGVGRFGVKQYVKVRNQWTYHARLYGAAKFVAESPEERNIHLVQLVSFGCGVDAVTTDEVRAIVEKSGRKYAQIKIDEISNSGAVTIRLRSLISVISELK